MPFSAKDASVYRKDVDADGQLLQPKQREELLKVTCAS